MGQRVHDQFGCVALSPDARRESVTDLQAPLRFFRVNTETAPADDLTTFQWANDPRGKPEGWAHSFIRAEPGKALLDGRRDIRVPHGRSVAHDREQWLRVQCREPGKVQALAIQ